MPIVWVNEQAGNAKASPLLAPVCYKREVPAVVVQCKINYVLFAGRLNGRQDVQRCQFDNQHLCTMAHLTLLEKRVMKHSDGYSCKASIGSEFWLTGELKPADVMRSFREIQLAK